MITKALIIVNVLAYLWEMSTGALHNDLALYRDGVLVPHAVLVDHEWWRIVSAAFLHASIAHIALNMLSLYWLGRFIEAVVGSWRMLVIYAVALVASGVTIVYFSPSDVATLGASGAIFGLFGALFAIAFKLGERGRQLARANIGILILNLVWTFAMPGISWQAHVGGLISGFVLTLLIFWPPQPVVTRVYDRGTGAVYESQVEEPRR